MTGRKGRIPVTVSVVLFTIIFAAAVNVTAATITVPDDYLTIQAAVNAASSGDIVYMRSGTYYEHVTIGKPLALQGEDRNTTIIDGGGTGKVITATSTSNVAVSGFTVRNGGSSWAGYNKDAGIVLDNTSHSLVSDCIVTSNGLNGLYSYRSSYNAIRHCEFRYNETKPGGGIQGNIHLRYSSHNTIDNNYIYSNDGNGITVRESSNNTTITGNHVYSNEGHGIHVGWSYYCTIADNTVRDNKGAGVDFDGASYNTVRDNMLSANGAGIRTVFYSNGETFVGNVIEGNATGIVIGGYNISSYGHVFYHNDVISNTVQVLIKVTGSNTWDNGYPSGGNYWSDYTGVDQDGDGIGDTPYVINAQNRDRYPLVRNSPPTADAGFDQTVEANVPGGAEVTLDGSGSGDTDGDSLIYLWTWDGESATGVSPTVTLHLGTTTVTLTVDDGNSGTDADTVDITVEDTTPPSILIGDPDPSVLRPPNHKMVEVVIVGIAVDECDPEPEVDVTIVVRDAEGGDGREQIDTEIVSMSLVGGEIEVVVDLRAERSGWGDGRIYEIEVTVTDGEGNEASQVVEVTVPHDQGNGKGKKK